MKIHEFQAKKVLASFGVAVPRGRVATTAEEAETIAVEFGGRRIHVTGYGYVDDEQVPAATLGYHLVEVTVFEDDRGSSGGGEEEIDFGQVSG